MQYNCIQRFRSFRSHFKVSFHSCQFHETAFIYKRENTEYNAVYCVSKFVILQILWDLQILDEMGEECLVMFSLSFSFLLFIPFFYCYIHSF